MELTRTAEPQINFAVVDLGSNTIRMTLYDVQEQGGFQALFSEKRMAGLVNYIRSGSLTREGIEVACSVLRGFQRLLAQFGPVPMQCICHRFPAQYPQYRGSPRRHPGEYRPGSGGALG